MVLRMLTHKEKEDNEKEPILQHDGIYSPPRLPVRYIIVFMSCVAITLNYSTRMNWSIAILSMVRQDNQSMLLESNSFTVEKSKVEVFDWDLETQQRILGVSYIGYTITPILGGLLIGRFGVFYVMLLGVGLSSVMAMLTPFCTRISIDLLIVTRIIDGFGQGMLTPGIFGITAKWAPINERSTYVSIITSGMSFGGILGSLLSTWICTSPFLGGWPSTFYMFGICGIVWCLAWCIVGSSEPANNQWISTFERDFILKSQPTDMCSGKDYHNIPWKKILTSAPMWSLCVGLFCYQYGYYLLYTDIPTFLETILGLNITASGLLNLLPHIAFFITNILAGIAADKVIDRGILGVTMTRKVMACFVLGVSSILLVLIGYTANNVTLAVILQMLVFGMYGLAAPSMGANSIDIAPNHSGLITGIIFTLTGSSGYIGTAVIGLVTRTQNTIYQWGKAFWITAGLQMVGLLTFLIFGTGDVQF